MGLGYATRTITANLGVFAALPLVSGVIGGFMARQKAIESLEEEKLFKRGGKERAKDRALKEKISQLESKIAQTQNKEEQEKLQKELNKALEQKELLNFVSAENLSKKIDQLSDKILAAKTDEEKRRLAAKLEARLNYTLRKLEDGFVNFGGGADYLNNQFELFDKLADGQLALTSLEADKIKDRKGRPLDYRVARFLGHKEKKIKKDIRKKVIKGAAVAAGASVLGYGIRHFFWGGPGVLDKDVTVGGGEGAEAGLTNFDEALKGTPESYFEEVGKGGVWGATEDQLEKHFGTAFKGLDEAQRTYIIDAIKDKIVADPEKFGLVGVEDIDNLKPGSKIDFSSIFQDEAGLEKIFGKAGALTDEQVENILRNNAILRDWVNNHPGEQLTSEKVERILDAAKIEPLKMPSELADIEVPKPVIPEVPQIGGEETVQQAAEEVAREEAPRVVAEKVSDIAGGTYEYFLANHDRLVEGALRFNYGRDGSILQVIIDKVRLKGFNPYSYLKNGWAEAGVQPEAMPRLLARIRELEIYRIFAESMTDYPEEQAFLHSAIAQGRKYILRNFGSVLK